MCFPPFSTAPLPTFKTRRQPLIDHSGPWSLEIFHVICASPWDQTYRICAPRQALSCYSQQAQHKTPVSQCSVMKPNPISFWVPSTSPLITGLQVTCFPHFDITLNNWGYRSLLVPPSPIYNHEIVSRCLTIFCAKIIMTCAFCSWENKLLHTNRPVHTRNE